MSTLLLNADIPQRSGNDRFRPDLGAKARDLQLGAPEPAIALRKNRKISSTTMDTAMPIAMPANGR